MMNEGKEVKLAIVVPCFNEEEVINYTYRELSRILKGLVSEGKISSSSYILFVDDGSQDKTWAQIESLSDKNNDVNGLKLAKNCGHQNALFAGLMEVSADAVISIDADLQDDVEKIIEMVDCYLQGFDIVYGVRSTRNVDSFFKRKTAEIYYKLFALLGGEVVFNHADYRLLSRRVLDSLSGYKEINLFLRGIIPSIGFSSTKVFYERKKRIKGESKYPTRKMVSFALDGITSHSMFPLRMISVLGFAIFVMTLVLSAWVLWVTLIEQKSIPGWASSVLPIYLLGGVMIFSLGVVGEYIGKIYLEVKSRPRYTIEKKI